MEIPKNLDRSGFDVNPNDPVDTEALADLQNFIHSNFSKVKTISRVSTSYGIKHLCEHYLRTYVSNGDLIAAMIMCGFNYERCNPQSPNAYFNISIEDVRRLSLARNHPSPF